MKFANVGDVRSEPLPKMQGQCPRCGGEVISKCGRIKVWHWAHKGIPPCDPWWENETDWHRTWKNHFPAGWQEKLAHDPATGETHIADVKTPHGLVIEFQHSPINPVEIAARETFYRDMIWIVDGDRGSLDPSYFNMGLSGPIQNNPLAYKLEWWGRSQLIHNWSFVTAKVYLDFGTDTLWRLVLFDRDKKTAIVGPIHKSVLINDCLDGRSISLLAMLEHDEDAI